MKVYRPYSREILLDHEQWQLVSERSGLQYEYNHNRKDCRKYDACWSILFQYIEKIIINKLTHRQQQVVFLYFYKLRTQVSIAKALGITQPTVNQHIYGKIRNGKYVGGARLKIYKGLFQQVRNKSNCSSSEQPILAIIHKLLDPKTSRHQISQFLHILNKSRF